MSRTIFRCDASTLKGTEPDVVLDGIAGLGHKVQRGLGNVSQKVIDELLESFEVVQ